MSAFGIRILTRILIPYTVGIFFIYLGGTGILKKEKIVSNIAYVLFGLLFSAGAIIHLLFVADVSMYS